MRSFLLGLFIAVGALNLSAQTAEPTPFMFITDMKAEWKADEATMDLYVYGNHFVSVRDTVCIKQEGAGRVVDAEGVRIKLEDSEGRKCLVEDVSLQPLSADSTGRILTIARFKIVADDGGAPRLPVRGWVSCRIHETPPTCVDVDEHIVHMMRFRVDSDMSGTVTDYTDHYMGVSLKKD